MCVGKVVEMFRNRASAQRCVLEAKAFALPQDYPFVCSCGGSVVLPASACASACGLAREEPPARGGPSLLSGSNVRLGAAWPSVARVVSGIFQAGTPELRSAHGLCRLCQTILRVQPLSVLAPAQNECLRGKCFTSRMCAPLPIRLRSRAFVGSAASAMPAPDGGPVCTQVLGNPSMVVKQEAVGESSQGRQTPPRPNG